MKKTIALLMMLCMVSCFAFAENAVIEPIHMISMENYGTEDCTLPARFETATAVDDNYHITFTPYQIDYYPAEQVKALKPGDKVVVFEHEFVVETIETEDEEININGECGLYFYPAAEEEGMMTCDDGTETDSSTDMGVYIFPLAEQVRMVTYRMNEDGEVQEGMDDQVMTPAEVKAFLEEHGDSGKANYLSAWGSGTSIRVADGKVQEITIDWSSDS